VVTLIVLGFLTCAAVIVSGYALSLPIQHHVGSAPEDIKAESVTFPSASGSTLHGWVSRGTQGRGVVILMHGVRADRRNQLSRIRLFLHAGYTVLAFDFQSHGESEGRRITFGYLEALDAVAAVNYSKREFPGEPTAIVAQSLGGAAALLAPQPLPVNAMVLESVYPDIDAAICDRLEVYLGRAGCLLTPLYSALMPAVIGIPSSKLRPIDHIGTISVPVLILSGTADHRTTIAEARDLFGHAPEPKEFWAVEGAAHVDLLNFARTDYEHHVMPFLAKYLR